MDFIALLLIAWLALYVRQLRVRIRHMEERLDAITGNEWARQPAPDPEPELVPEPETPWQAALEPPSPVVAPPVIPVPTLGERLRRMLGDEEWETLVGGSLLNKLGALVLVIGIALFLGFSFAHMTPMGRASIAFAVSVAVLGAGVWTERRERYRVFARGLIGAGWAGLYATAYAAYSIPEARVFENPFAGSLGMLAVAVAMIAHSLQYKAPAVTGVAYFAAFAALAATPSSPFAVISLVPLAISILYLAAKFNWYSMAVFGLAASYLTCISRGNSDAPLVETQPLFLTYWLLFDAFDLLRMKRRVLAGGIEWIYPLNLAGFIGLSYLSWAKRAPDQLWLAATAGAALFAADAVLRAILLPASSFESRGDLNTRLRAGSYEGSALVSSVLAGMAIVAKVPGVWMSAGLALEAEILYVAGLRLQSSFLRRLGTVAFAHSLARLVLEPIGTTAVLGHKTYNWSPPAIFHAVLFYVNRALRRPNVVMSSAAAVLIAAVIFAEAATAWAGTIWIVFGLVLFEIGLREVAVEFRYQAYALLAAGAVATAVGGDWPEIAISLAGIYGCAVRSRRPEFLEHRAAAYGASAAAVMLGAVLIWRLVPVEYAALGWFGMALVVLEIGMRGLPGEMRDLFMPAGVLAIVGLAATHGSDFAKFPAPAVWITFFGASAIAFAAAARTRESVSLRDGSACVGIAAAMAGIWLVTPDTYVGDLWMALALLLLHAGTRLDIRAALIESYVVAAMSVAAALVFDIDPPRLFGSCAVVAGMFAGQYMLTRSRNSRAAAGFSGGGTLLLCAVLYGEVSGSLLTVSWGFEGLALLAAGFLLRERVLRLQGLGLLLICILKLFVYDLRNLETLYRILSFVALGLILLGVSWIYTRFRDHLRKLL